MKRMLISSVAIGLAVQISSFCAAEERSEQDHSAMSRTEWQAQVSASRERAKIARRERRNYIPLPPTAEEIAAKASRRVLEDDSLRPGDIISTDRGLFRFQGFRNGERSTEDFVRIR